MVRIFATIVFLVLGTLTDRCFAADAVKSDRPTLVLVGADWCPGCRVMKDRVMPEVVRLGALVRVHYVYYDLDKNPVEANQQTGGSVIPQLIMYEKSDGKPCRWKKAVGVQTVQQVVEFLRFPLF